MPLRVLRDLATSDVELATKFGTLRYQVSFELYALGEEILPGERIRIRA